MSALDELLNRALEKVELAGVYIDDGAPRRGAELLREAADLVEKAADLRDELPS